MHDWWREAGKVGDSPVLIGSIDILEMPAVEQLGH